MSVKLWPDPIALTDKSDSPASLMAASTSSTLRGCSIRAGVTE